VVVEERGVRTGQEFQAHLPSFYLVREVRESCEIFDIHVIYF
jgi:hypothetical protein